MGQVGKVGQVTGTRVGEEQRMVEVEVAGTRMEEGEEAGARVEEEGGRKRNRSEDDAVEQEEEKRRKEAEVKEEVRTQLRRLRQGQSVSASSHGEGGLASSQREAAATPSSQVAAAAVLAGQGSLPPPSNHGEESLVQVDGVVDTDLESVSTEDGRLDWAEHVTEQENRRLEEEEGRRLVEGLYALLEPMDEWFDKEREEHYKRVARVDGGDLTVTELVSISETAEEQWKEYCVAMTLYNKLKEELRILEERLGIGVKGEEE